MTEVSKHITLPKNVETKDALDFSFLREKGLEYIEQLSSELWTDYNSHDPGITILEMLAYAITDLGARIEMPLENILASGNGKENTIENQFFKAIDIFPSQPVTEIDYRKLFIDIEGVKNCWIKPFDKEVYVDCKNNRMSYNSEIFSDINETFKRQFKLQGLYSILVDFDEYLNDDVQENQQKQIIDEITNCYHANRNLCEDLITVTEVKKHTVKVCVNIELDMKVDEELVHAKIIRAINNYFSPSLKFYSLKQMLDKGYSTGNIFEGPVLENGFIDSTELENADLRTEVRLSDLMRLIMNIDGVKVIKDISLQDCEKPNTDEESWILCVDKGKKPSLCEKSIFNYFKSVLPVNINQAKSRQYQAELEKKDREEQKNARLQMEPEIPKGVVSDTELTTTIQNDFPDTYGIGPNGLLRHAGTIRHAQAKQLQGYLLFFDQILATYFAHLGKVKDLLSINSKLKETYFSQAVKDIKGFSELVSNYPQNDDDQLSALLMSDFDNNILRKNQILDHLIARFAEKFSDYSFLMNELYGVYSEQVVLQTKEAFLKDYNQTSQKRGSAFNYYRQAKENLWNTDNVSGVQKRISRLVGIKDYTRRSLSKTFVEIYDFKDSKDRKVYRWRIRNKANKILLTKTENYPSERLAEIEMNLAITKILEITQDVIDEAFQGSNEEGIIETLSDDTLIGNLQVKVSNAGNYSFNVINRDANPNSTQWVIARQFSYYATIEELKNAMLELVDFIVSQFSEEGMFLLEHILLRPDVTDGLAPFNQFMPICEGDCDENNLVDPFSYRVTIVLPGWGHRFANSDFREYLEKLIRNELPAHILARICWVGYRKKQRPDNENNMLLFEKAYQEFLFTKTNLGQKQNAIKLTKLFDKVNGLTTIYSPGELIDCANEEEELRGKIILGRTNI